MGLYKFHVDCGRMGELSGIFFATREQVSDLIGREVYFGEVLGKYSDVYFTLKESHFTLLTEDEDFVSKALAFGLATGTNPFDYIGE